MIKIAEWNSCLEKKPEAEGNYLVIRVDKNGNLGYASYLHYTLEYGWNTYAENHRDPIIFSPDNIFDKDYFWTTVTKEEADNE